MSNMSEMMTHLVIGFRYLGRLLSLGICRGLIDNHLLEKS